MKFKLGVIFGLAGLIVMSSLGLIYNKHANRQLIAELRELQNQNDLLHIKNGQLQLEFGAWTTHQMIEQKAKKSNWDEIPRNK